MSRILTLPRLVAAVGRALTTCGMAAIVAAKAAPAVFSAAKTPVGHWFLQFTPGSESGSLEGVWLRRDAVELRSRIGSQASVIKLGIVLDPTEGDIQSLSIPFFGGCLGRLILHFVFQDPQDVL